MKVKKLIEQLKQCDPEAVICSEALPNYDEFFDACIIEVRRFDQRFYYDTAMALLRGNIVVIKNLQPNY